MAIRSRNKVSAEFSSASISDIVFLLLIYFMLTASFVKQSSLKVELPEGSSDIAGDRGNYITITEDQTYAWNNQLLDQRDDLIPFIEEVLQDDDLENDVISLRLDRQAVVEDAVFVMDVVAKNNGKVFILTRKQ